MGTTDSFFSKVKNVFSSNETPEIEKGRSFVSAGDRAPESKLPYASWYYEAPLGQPRNVNLMEVRQYAKSPWVQMVVNTIIKQVKDTEWFIVPSDEEDETDYTEIIKQITDFLEFPNSRGDTFDDLWGAYLRDILELDSGVIYKGRNSGKLVELFAYDGARFLIDMDRHTMIKGYYQYSVTFPGAAPLRFEPKELIYGKINNNTEFFPYGWAPLQSILQEVEVLIQSTRYNKEFFQNNAVPDAFIQQTMSDDKLKEFKEAWNNQIKKKPHKTIFTNAENLDVKVLNTNNKDMEWLEGQKWYHHIVFGAYGLSPQEVGFYENSNKSTGESQERVTVKNAIRPYLAHIADKINREIIPELLEGDEQPIKFKWFPQDHVQEKLEHEQNLAKLNANVYTINEIRAMEGKEPVEWGDQPMSMIMQDRMIESEGMQDNEEGDKKKPNREEGVRPNQKPKDQEEPNKTPKDIESSKDKKKPKDTDSSKDKKEPKKKVKILDKSKSLPEEADDYASFLASKFKEWESQLLSAVDSNLSSEVPAKQKAFQDFIMKVFNIVKTKGFERKIAFYVGKDMRGGLASAEKELKLDIGISEEFRNRMKTLATQQMDGYMINGKVWQGIKGVASDLQRKIMFDVGESLRNRDSLKTIKDNIKDTMAREAGGTVDGKVTEGRAMRIARTETTNFINAGRLQAYKDSGVEGIKVWDATLDRKTSELCKRLDGQERGLYEDFTDEVTGNSWQRPTSHVNCRCRIKMKVTEKELSPEL